MEASPPWLLGHCLDLALSDGSGPARWATQVRLLWQDTGLWLRFDCADNNRWASYQGHNDPLWLEEVVEVFLAEGAEVPDRYWEIEVNPLGTVFEARVHNPDGERRSMSLDMDARCHGLRTKVGWGDRRDDWSVELFLPWKGLGVAENQLPAAIWRANFLRVERPEGQAAGDDEFSSWAATWRRPADFHVPACFGVVVLDAHPELPHDYSPVEGSANIPIVRVPHWQP